MIQLPFEIWDDIVKLVWPEHLDCPILKRKSLGHLCATNTMLNRVTTPYLYRWCEADMVSSAKVLRRALLSNSLAITSVRHLKIRAAISYDSLETMPIAWAQALEGMPNLVSLALEPVLETGTNGDAYLSTTESSDFARVVFANPKKLPFRIKLFSTNLACSPALNEFLFSQTSLSSIHWINPRALEGHDPVIPSSVISQALTKFPTCAALETYLPMFLAEASSVRRLLVDTDVTEPEWVGGFETGPLRGMPALCRLEKLTLLADPDYGAYLVSFLDAVVPSLHSLAVLEVSCWATPSYDYPMVASQAIPQLPNLRSFIFNATCCFKQMRQWSEALRGLPDDLELYTIYDCVGWGRSEWEYVRFLRDQQGNWEYDSLPFRTRYPTKAGAEYDWHTMPNPEGLMDITSLVYWN